jgi:hypothetical protein
MAGGGGGAAAFPVDLVVLPGSEPPFLLIPAWLYFFEVR